MSARKTVKRMALVVAAFAAVTLAGSIAGASGVGNVGGSGSGLASLFDNGTYRLELGAVTGSGSNPAVCVKVTSKATNRRAEGCGNVTMFVHPTLDMAIVQGTVRGNMVDAKSGRTLRTDVPIAIDLQYEGIGMYQALIGTPQSPLPMVYPLDVAVRESLGIGRAAWGWGSVTAPVCQTTKTAKAPSRGRARATTVDVTCGPASDAPAFAGTIAQMATVTATVAGN